MYLLIMEVAAMQNLGVIQSIITRKLIRAMEKTVELIEKCEESNLLRLDGKAFTRERKLGPRRILDMLLL
ncbi:MAG: hypothetical protein LBS19_03680, partial [Clostridiales bacterium]|nr:hypothetical protein [Clostridiales bacterium]